MQRRVLLSPAKVNTNRTKASRVAKDAFSSFNYDEYKEDVTVLRSKANMKIADVSSNAEVQAVLQRVHNTLQTMSGDSAVYSSLKSIIDTQFSDLATPIPYTLGARFRGWQIKTNMDGTDFEPCVAVRIGSIQRPGIVNKCKYIAMYADWSEDKFTFSSDVINPESETRPLDRVVINVPFGDVSTFPGFSPEEKKELQNNGITEACILGFRAGSNEYHHLTKSSFISIDNIKTRYVTSNGRVSIKPNANVVNSLKSSSTKLSNGNDKNNNGYSASAWIFFILIIIIILILIFCFWK